MELLADLGGGRAGDNLENIAQELQKLAGATRPGLAPGGGDGGGECGGTTAPTSRAAVAERGVN